MEAEARVVIVEARNVMHEEIRKALFAFSAKTGLTVASIDYRTDRFGNESEVCYWDFETEIRI